MRIASIEVIGLKQALKRLHAIADTRERLKAFKAALRAVGAMYLRLFRARAKKHDSSGTLRRALKSKLVYKKSWDTLVIVIGVKSWFSGIDSRGKKRIAHKYNHLVLFGRRAFAQRITILPGRSLLKYKNKGNAPVTVSRRIGGFSGDNFIAEESQRYSYEALQTANKAILKWLERSMNS